MAVIVAVAVLAAPAAGAPRFKPFARSSTKPLADAGRWVAWSARSGMLRVLDTERGTIRDILPPACDYPRLVGHAGRVLFVKCLRDERYALSAATGRVLNAPGFELRERESTACGGDCDTILSTLGAHWGVEVSRYGRPDRFLNWRTGERRERTTSETHFDDIDAPSLSVPVCAPFRRIRTLPYDDGPDGIVRGGWVLRIQPGAGYVVERCGGRGPRQILGSCSPRPRSLPVVIGCHRDDERNHDELIDVYALPSMRRTTWNLEAFDRDVIFPPTVALTRRWLFVSLPHPINPPVYTILRARIPR